MAKTFPFVKDVPLKTFYPPLHRFLKSSLLHTSKSMPLSSTVSIFHTSALVEFVCNTSALVDACSRLQLFCSHASAIVNSCYRLQSHPVPLRLPTPMPRALPIPPLLTSTATCRYRSTPGLLVSRGLVNPLCMPLSTLLSSLVFSPRDV
jgi:hypothetical protein